LEVAVPARTDAEWSARWRDVLAVAGVIALLALAAPGADAMPAVWRLGTAGRGQGAARVVIESVIGALALAAAGVVAALVLVVLRRRRRRKDDEPERVVESHLGDPWARVVAVVVVLLAVAAPFVVLAVTRNDLAGRPAPPPAGTAASSPAPTGRHGASVAASHGGGLLTVMVFGVAALVLLMAVGWLGGRRRRAGLAIPVERPRATPPATVALLAATSEAGPALWGDDARSGVLRCYSAMVGALRRAGVTGRAADVPGELLARAADAGVVSAAPVRELTDLFGEARFSSHPFTEAHRQAAAIALDRIRRDLGVRP
jgi:multisubunit Na+/H+ antiporter MnhB subunit